MSTCGFVESCTSTATRSRPTFALPDRGPFTFPAPYGTTSIRLTNPEDTGGQDALWPCGYSYWSNVNAHMGEPNLLVFLGVDRQRGGAGPSLWSVDKATDAVTPLGPIFPPEHPLSWATGEGWYWSATDPHVLYASDPSHLYRVDVRTKAITPVIDVSGNPFHKYFWQWHTAHDGRTHSATVKDLGTSRAEGCIVYREGQPEPVRWRWYPARGDLDECQIDASGQWLLIKSNVDATAGEDNLIVHVEDEESRILLDQQGAAGHSDNGHGYMVAADNWHNQPNALRLWMFDKGLEPQGRLVYHSPTWDVELNHISHGNARAGAPDGQWVLGSGATRHAGPRANELVAVPLDGSLRVVVIAPTMVDLDARGGGSDDYSKLPKANVCPAGEYALWTSNHGGARLDAFLVKIPAEHLR